MAAVLPSADIATEAPWVAAPVAPLPNSLFPNCDHTPAVRLNIHAAPAVELSKGPPMMAVLPSNDKPTELPNVAEAEFTVSLLPCCVQALPLRVKTHTAPPSLLSKGPPIRAVL